MTISDNIPMFQVAEPRKKAAGRKLLPKEATLSCMHCGLRDMRRLTRTITDRILCVRRHKCIACTKTRSEFRFHWTLLVWFGLVPAMVVGLYYFADRATSAAPGPAAAPQADLLAMARAQAAAGGQLTAYEQMLSKRSKSTLDNSAIIQLRHEKVDINVMLQMIKNSNADYDLTPRGMIELRHAEIEPSLLLAMIDASYSTR